MEELNRQQNNLVKDRECLHCEKFFDCNGKPRDIKQCVNFTERKKKDGNL